MARVTVAAGNERHVEYTAGRGLFGLGNEGRGPFGGNPAANSLSQKKKMESFEISCVNCDEGLVLDGL